MWRLPIIVLLVLWSSTELAAKTYDKLDQAVDNLTRGLVLGAKANGVKIEEESIYVTPCDFRERGRGPFPRLSKHLAGLFSEALRRHGVSVVAVRGEGEEMFLRAEWTVETEKLALEQQKKALIERGRETKKRAEAVRVAFEGAEKALGQGEVWKAKSYVEELRELDAGDVRIEGLERELGEVVRAVGRRFRECEGCPWMVVVPEGSFDMGSPKSEAGRKDHEGPVHRVRIERPFAVGVYEVTFAEWDACVSGGGCGGYRPNDKGWGRGNRPVINVGWEDARSYVDWLSKETGEEYRLLSESEWEYVARGGTRTPFHTGETISTGQANYDGRYTYGSGREGRYRRKTVAVGSFDANGYGLHDVHGNVWEWVEDCWNGSYRRAPADGSAWEFGDCSRRVLRGGSWRNTPGGLRSADRIWVGTGYRVLNAGIRVARTLAP